MRFVVAVVVALSICGAAAADVGVVAVAPTVAAPGELVTVRVDGYLGPRPWRPMPIVLVSRRLQPHPFRCGPRAICEPTRLPAALRRPPFHLVGAVNRWRAAAAMPETASGTLTFRVPRLGAGVYVPMLVCDGCVRGPRVSLIATPKLVLHVR